MRSQCAECDRLRQKFLDAAYAHAGSISLRLPVHCAVFAFTLCQMEAAETSLRTHKSSHYWKQRTSTRSVNRAWRGEWKGSGDF